MSWRLRVEHQTVYSYAGEVRSSYNEARISPLTTPAQLVLEGSVEVQPATHVFRYIDYWGSVVHAFDIAVPHTALTVIGRSVVQTSNPPEARPVSSWDELEAALQGEGFTELLAPTAIVNTDPALQAVADDIKARNAPAEAAQEIVSWVRSQLAYVKGTTAVSTSALEAWHGRRGVCQDFAHLTLAVARAAGIPGRYCSGYLHPQPASEVGSSIEGESHAWLELWLGDWGGYDPTIDGRPGERHVLVARGRDYSDVSPLKGVFNGGPTASLSARVQLTRLS